MAEQADVFGNSRLVWGLRGYYFTLLCQIGVSTCYYGIQLVYGYLVCLALALMHWASVDSDEHFSSASKWSSVP